VLDHLDDRPTREILENLEEGLRSVRLHVAHFERLKAARQSLRILSERLS